MITKLKSDIKRFTHIIHVADLHIRLNKRHDEYRDVFAELYKEIKNSPETTLVAVLGDVFHSKSDLSPECIQMAYDFFTGLTNLRPTILISGNHDATLSSKSRLDSLTPIIDALNIPTLYYLKNNGLYGLGNILFNHMSVFDEPSEYIRGKDIPKIYRNEYEKVIALYHGPIDGAATDTGYRITNPSVMTPLFDYHDIALLGDIHKAQDMQDYDASENKPCVRYAGSCIQQNHGENLFGHGYSMWDLSNNSYVHHELKNICGHFTIEIHNGKLVTNLTDLPKQVRLRVKCFETIATEVKTIIADIKLKSEVLETSYLRIQQDAPKNLIPIYNNIALNNLSSEAYQKTLITKFLNEKCKITDSKIITDILEINKQANASIKQDEFARNLKWKPIKFEFDNMFTYGENNVIDFTNMSGTYGIFGPNASGKSSILSAITFCLFDKFDRGFKGIMVRNAKKTSFRCKFEIEISGIRYFIERTGTTSKAGNVKVDVEFWTMVGDERKELHGTARRNTNEVIRDYIGTYEDFILTTLSVQTSKNNISFIDMGNTERKDLLVQFIGLNVFDKLSEAASERNKEVNVLLKTHKNRNYVDECNQYAITLVGNKKVYAEELKLTENLRKQIADVNDQIVVETSNLIKLEDNTPTNIELTKTEKESYEAEIKKKKSDIKELSDMLEAGKKQLLTLEKNLKKIEESNFVEEHKIYKSLCEISHALNNKIDLKKVEIKGKLDKASRLSAHKFDPNCKFCIDNEFVKDAMNAKNGLINDKVESDKLLKDRAELKEKIEKYEWVEEVYENYTELLTEKSKFKDEHFRLSEKFIIFKNNLEKLESKLKDTTNGIELYYRNELSVKHNEKINSNIISYRNALVKLDSEFRNHNNILMEIGSKNATLQSKIEELTKVIDEIKELERESFLYKMYLETVGRDGIPYQVMCNVVPEIENEINSILTQIVNYTIELETDGKNIIPYIVYDECKWPIELSSGFERFVASIAIRVALTEISNLPKCSIFLCDEGFGTIDSDNMSSMSILLSALKSKFDFIIVVSHIDAMKDAVDNAIEIKRVNDFSNVRFE